MLKARFCFGILDLEENSQMAGPNGSVYRIKISASSVTFACIIYIYTIYTIYINVSLIYTALITYIFIINVLMCLFVNFPGQPFPALGFLDPPRWVRPTDTPPRPSSLKLHSFPSSPEDGDGMGISCDSHGDGFLMGISCDRKILHGDIPTNQW